MRPTAILAVIMFFCLAGQAQSAPKLGDKQIDRPSAMASFYCPGADVQFTADGPEATIRFTGDTYNIFNNFNHLAVDNVALVKKSVFDAFQVDVGSICTPCSTGIASGLGWQTLDIPSIPAQDLLYYENFQNSIPGTWTLDPHMRYIADTIADWPPESAPNEYLAGAVCDSSGGSLGFGLPDSLSDFVSAEFSVTGLEEGEEYVCALWLKSNSGLNTMHLEVFGTPFWEEDMGAGLETFSQPSGLSWVDFNQDGLLDIYISRFGNTNGLFQNSGSGFTNVTTAPMSTAAQSTMALWGDYNNDGFPDAYMVSFGFANKLLMGNGTASFTDLAPGTPLQETAGVGACAFDLENDGDLDILLTDVGDSKLFRNDGASWMEVGGGNVGTATAASEAADFDRDGDQDVFLANNGATNQLMENQAGVLVDVTPAIMQGLSTTQTFDCAWGDYDNDGDPDLYVVNHDDPNFLFRNDAGTFVDVTTPLLQDSGDSYSADWLDMENDGDLDLFVSHTTFGNRMFRNDGGSFSEALIDPLDYTYQDKTVLTAAVADYNNDGQLDVLLSDGMAGNSPRVFNNIYGYAGNWLEIELVGVASNRDGIGAHIEIHTLGTRQSREVRAGNGFYSQSTKRAHFGLGNHGEVGLVRVTWPSGIVQDVSGVAANQIITITEQATSVSIPEEPMARFAVSVAPNPFVRATEIRYILPASSHVTLEVFDLNGRLVRVLANEMQSAGSHVLPWDGFGVHGGTTSAGLYFYRLRASGQVVQGKFIKLDL